jgi:hypothetical protein
MVCNYKLSFAKDYTLPGDQYYISPNLQASEVYLNRQQALDKLTDDLQKMKDMGFTEVRLTDAVLGGVYPWPMPDQTQYFLLMDQLMALFNDKGMRVILLMASGRGEFTQNETFKNFLYTFADHFKNQPAIMAYDLYNEPENLLHTTRGITTEKYQLSKVIAEWCSSIRKADQNHLITIGTYPDSYAYDYELMPIDFVSYHIYPYTDYINTSLDYMKVYNYWSGKTTRLPWIIGETGFGGSSNPAIYGDSNDPDHKIGTETDQATFASTTAPLSVNCNCKGYSWWLFQDMHGNYPGGDYMGTYKTYLGPPNTLAGQVKKPVGAAFDGLKNTAPTYQGMSMNASNCARPSNYYTFQQGSSGLFTGSVKDENNVGIANALIIASDGSHTYRTYAKEASAGTVGDFSVNTHGYPIVSLTITYPGYSNLDYRQAGGLPSLQTYNLTKINRNNWVKQGTNGSFNKLEVVDDPTKDWILSDVDKFYKGDFNGDGQEDLFCIKYSAAGVNTDRMAVLTYSEKFVLDPPYNTNSQYILRAGWKVLWDNNSNSSSLTYPYRNNFVVGDFDGNGRDDIISVGSWTTSFYFGTDNDWHFWDSNMGNMSNLSGLGYYSSNVVTGNFNGLGRDLIIGVNSGGYVASFEYTNHAWVCSQYSNSTVPNSNPGYEISALTPYISKFVTGDFDGDGMTELLGIQPGAGTPMALFKRNVADGKWIAKWYDATGNTSGMGAYRGNLQVGNFDSDNYDEILGINANYCVAFNFNPSTYAVEWDGTYNSIISDWSIPKGSAIYDNYMFLNTDKYSKQQHLLTFRHTGLSFVSNLYAFKPNTTSYAPCSTLRLANPTDATASIESTSSSNGEMQIFPNPNEGMFSVSLPGEADMKNVKVEIYDNLGRMIAAENYQVTGSSENLLDVKYTSTLSGVYYLKVFTSTSIFVKSFIKL